MGRVKIQLKKIEEKRDRQISYSKRKDGLIKKAYELTTLCDVDVALIIFSSAGKLNIFDGKRRIEDTLKRYIDLPYSQRGRNIVIDNPQLEEANNEISMLNIDIDNVEKQLEYFVKSSSGIKSTSDAEYREGVLEETLKRVSLHKNGQMERSLDPAEEEAIRVIEIGDVIGFDFSCEEEEVLNEIARRENEDNDKGRSKAG
ncbi:hypothetical protein Q3G72_011898 [Acer saccharum]|nr:hypothetical protein Q3G72_011898 [Acer saccharum]